MSSAPSSSLPPLSNRVPRAAIHTEILLRSVPGMAWTVDRDGQMVSYNEALAHEFRDAFGFEIASVANNLAALPEGLADEWRCVYQRAFDGEVYSLEQSMHIRGREEHFLVTIAPIRDDDTVLGAFVLAMNVTSRVLVEQAARDREARLAAVIRSASEGMAAIDIEGRVEQWNPAATAICGYTEAEMLGRHFTTLLPADRHAHALEFIRRVMAMEPIEPYETEFLHRDGSNARARITLAPIVRNGAVAGVVMIAHDMREHQRLLSQLNFAERMASVGTLAAGVAHQVNNPLAVVKSNLDDAAMNLQRLERDLRSAGNESVADELAAVLEAVNDSRSGADRVRDIVRDLRTFARVDRLGEAAIQIAPVAESAIRMVRDEIDARARLVCDFGEVPSVRAGEAQIAQVLLNLLRNAAQAIPCGAPDAHEIRVVIRPGDASRVAIEVRDTGVGIGAEDVGRVFDPFFTTKPIGTGKGLGLSVCHGIVSALGGTISIESNVGRGTSVTIMIPTADAEAQTTAPLPEAPRSSVPVTRARVLCLDDEPMVLTSLRRMLALEHDVTAHARGSEVVALVAAGERFDAIVSDLMMPELTGMDLYEQIAAIDPAQAERIVYITGGAFTPAAERFLRRMPNLCLEKPFEPNALRLAVRDVVARGAIRAT